MTPALALTGIALSGASLEVDADEHTLLALTQLASVLRPGSTMTIRNGDFMTPIERACIMTAASSRVEFLDKNP